MTRHDALESKCQELTGLVKDWCQTMLELYENGEYQLNTPEGRRRFIERRERNWGGVGNRPRAKLVGLQLGVSIIDAYERVQLPLGAPKQ